MSTSYEKFKQLDLSRDEVERIGEALKKDEFRQLLHDYVKEIQDPENKKIYEQEIIQLEKERGIDATFINPQPGYVIKTSVNGNRKCFVNICVNDNVHKPTSTPTIKDDSRGLQWSLPHSLTPAREDLDRKGVRCSVYDVVFHPDTLHLANNNKAFHNMVNNVACDAVESNFDVKLDRKNLKFPKIQYKGMPHASLIRKPSKEPGVERQEPFEKELYDKIYAQADNNQQKVNPQSGKKASQDTNNTPYTTPKFLIKHRTHVDIQEFVESKEAKLQSAIPKELIVDINLPLLKSASDVALDVTEKTLQLISETPAKYKLDVTLPYRVFQDNGNAKFDKDLKKLIVTLPVKRGALIEYNNRDDSGVDSDQNSPSPPTHEEKTTHENKVLSDESDRTNFLDGNNHYNLPEFTCHLYENILAFIIHVKNVDETTVDKIIDSSSIHLKFANIGSSFYTEHYAFYLALPGAQIVEEQVQIDTWDNNLTLHIPFDTDGKLTQYLYGIDGSNLDNKHVDEPEVLYNLLEDAIAEETQPDVNKEENIITNNEDKQSSAINISGTSYESSGDELSCSFSPSQGKGILKNLSSNRRFAGRSISESSLDDYVIATSLDSANIQVCSSRDDVEISTSLKKTVRFNDVIKKQLYRSNSSILGQKKKNQRKSRNKKRAQERRHSESEASEVEDRKEDKSEVDDKSANFNSDIFHMDMNC